jgi:hypothetical protein
VSEVRCVKCDSHDIHPYTAKPPARGGRGNHVCDEGCSQRGIFCRTCRFFQPISEGGLVEVHDGELTEGLSSIWLHDANHGPWQATAPGWAVREFARLREMMRDGRWSPPVVVGDMGEGHLVHCQGIWDDGELVCPPERNTYYEATVKWSDGTISPLALWNDVGFG